MFMNKIRIIILKIVVIIVLKNQEDNNCMLFVKLFYEITKYSEDLRFYSIIHVI